MAKHAFFRKHSDSVLMMFYKPDQSFQFFDILVLYNFLYVLGEFRPDIPDVHSGSLFLSCYVLSCNFFLHSH